MMARRFVRGDIDGFFGLFIDNLLQLMLISVLCRHVCRFPDELVSGRIIPGAALSILAGNLFYAWQARRLMRETGREDVTALPYGINTPSLVAFVLLIMSPVYNDQFATLRAALGDAEASRRAAGTAWQAGLFACFLSGLIECAGAFCGGWLRRVTPRAALLSTLAGIAITFISMNFMFQLFAMPAVALVPMFLILVAYAGRIRLPLGLPGGLVAVLVGVGLAWGLRLAGLPSFTPPAGEAALALHLPRPAFGDVFALCAGPDAWRYLSVIVPMGLFNVIGSLQNLESAEAAGDRYATAPSMLTNGLGSLLAACCGSPFPTTIYIGHPAWKAMGARAAYSTLNGVVIAILCLAGGVDLVLRVVPVEATLGILLWIGIVITAQAFQEVPRAHLPAVAFGLIPSLAAWGLFLVKSALGAAGTNLHEKLGAFAASPVAVTGMIALSQGFMLSAVIFSATLVFIVERSFLRAASWMGVAALLSWFGFMHAWTLSPQGEEMYAIGFGAAPWFAAAYAATAAILVVLHLARRGGPGLADNGT